jgi:hypothetical protein
MRVGRGEGGELTASESGDGEEEMGVLDSGAADLGGEEEDGACEDAPVAWEVEFLDEEIGADACFVVRWNEEDIRRRCIPLRSRPTKLRRERAETCMSWRCWMKAGLALSSQWRQRALASLPMLLSPVSVR